MWSIILGLLPVAIMLMGYLPLVAAVVYWKRRTKKREHENPLSRDLLRSPGHSLREKCDELFDEFIAVFVFVSITPILMYAIHISQSYWGGIPESAFRTAMMLVTTAAFMGYFMRRLSQLRYERNKHKLGLEGELASAEVLNQLMLHGCRVFHDIPMQYGNIDHVVVCSTGVYSINTKALSKPKQGAGRAKVVVDYQSHTLKFTDRSGAIPVNQLQTESKWLSEHLSKSVGTSVSVKPILALPGWYVEGKYNQAFYDVMNPKNQKHYFLNRKELISEQEVIQISHQLEQLCRNITPSFKEEKKWQTAT